MAAIVPGLVAGKTLGLPGASALAGIGFTMSLFIPSLLAGMPGVALLAKRTS